MRRQFQRIKFRKSCPISGGDRRCFYVPDCCIVTGSGKNTGRQREAFRVSVRIGCAGSFSRAFVRGQGFAVGRTFRRSIGKTFRFPGGRETVRAAEG
ncbi:hypothetical protein YDYSY3_01180 [Paenibacillus chitinolyticus]|nr:hypothetical protein YDYSY3_01180 [Paenibacillus chitinolyticus]